MKKSIIFSESYVVKMGYTCDVTKNESKESLFYYKCNESYT